MAKTILGGSRLKRIHVNRHIIGANSRKMRDAANEGFMLGEGRQRLADPLSVVHKGKTYHAVDVDVLGPSRLIYRPLNPLPCGATTWIETHAPVTITQSLT